MGSDVHLTIVDPVSGAVVVHRWIGMSATRDRMREVLARTPDFEDAGWESWGQVSEGDSRTIAETHYAGGATPEDVDRWRARFPRPRYWWMLDHDY